jgi:hypothetical protein
MALPGAYSLPKDIGEMALRFIKDGMEAGQALGTARMLSNNPQDPTATAFTKDLMGRLEKAKTPYPSRRKSPYSIDPEPNVSGLSIPTKNWTLKARPVAVKFPGDEKTTIAQGFQENAASAGAERRLVAEVVNSVAAGDRETFMQILSDLGFGPNVIRNLANRYVPEIIEYNPGRLELP